MTRNETTSHGRKCRNCIYWILKEGGFCLLKRKRMSGGNDFNTGLGIDH